MPDGKQYIRDLRSNLIHAYGANEVPSENDFFSKLQNQQYRRDIYENLQHAYGKDQLPVFTDFESKMGFAAPVKETPQKPVEVPSLKEFLSKNQAPISTQRNIAEGTFGKDLAMKVQNDFDVATAPERKRVKVEKEQKDRTDAIRNTTINKLNSEGLKFTEGDAVYKKAYQQVKNAADADELALTYADGKPVFARKLGALESIKFAFNETLRNNDVSKTFYDAPIEERIKIAYEESKRAPEGIPSGLSGILGESLGMGAVPFSKTIVGSYVGTTLFPGIGTISGAIGGLLANVGDVYKSGYKDEIIKLFINDIENQKSRGVKITPEVEKAAMERATELGSTAGAIETAVFAPLTLIPGGSPAASAGLRSAIKQMAKHSVYDASRQAFLGAGAELVKAGVATSKGYNVDVADAIDYALQRGGKEFELGMAMHVYTNTAQFPKYMQSAAKNYLSTIPRPDLNNIASALEGQGSVKPGTTEKLNADLDAFESAKSKVSSVVPEEDIPSFAGLAEKKDNLLNQKKNTEPVLHPKIDEQISAIDNRMKKMLESAEPMKEEVDDLTGSTGDAAPYTDTKIDEDVRVLSGEGAVKEVIPDVEFDLFVDRGTIPEDRIISIADKISKNQQLSEREVAIYSAKGPDIEARVKEIVAVEPTKEVPAEEKAYSVKYLERLDEKQLLKRIDKMDEPMDARGLAMKALVYGRRKVSQDSFGGEVGRGQERFASPFVDKGGKGKGVSVERMAEDIWFDLPEELQAQMEPQDIRNELLDIIGTYTSTKKLAEDYVKRYTPEDFETRMIDEDFVDLGDDGVMKLADWEKWAKEEITAEQAGLADEKVIDDLITKYEQEPTTEGKGITQRQEGETPERVVPDNAYESARKNATKEELGGFDRFIADEQARPDFDAEYTANRTIGESKQEYLLRKYCK